MDDTAVEQEIQRKGLTAPRITPADLHGNIVGEFYFTAQEGLEGSLLPGAQWAEAVEFQGTSAPPLKTLTFCVLVLRNGFTVTGESACASPVNFNAALGRQIAKTNAVQKIWPLMGYALRERLHERELAEQTTAST